MVGDSGVETGLSETEIANGHASGPQTPPGIYLVRVPKPPIDETALKATQAEFQAHVDKLKKFNVVVQKKRVSNPIVCLGTVQIIEVNSTCVACCFMRLA